MSENTGEQIHLEDTAGVQTLEREEKMPLVPPHWTTLYHGANLARPQWQGRESLLEDPTFTVEGMGLSAISEEDRQMQRELSQAGMKYDTTGGYASMTPDGLMGTPVELRIILPAFHRRKTGYEDVLAENASRYGQEVANKMLALSDETFWMNDQGGRHPIVPSGLVLDRLSGTTAEDGQRIVTYVPHDLREIYEREIASLVES